MKIPGIEDRLSQLERQNKRLRWLIVAALAVACGSIVLPGVSSLRAEQPLERQTVKAAKFMLLGPGGQTRATLGFSGAVPQLVFYDGSGKKRASLAIDASGPQFTLYDAGGMQRAKLAEDTEGPYLGLNSRTGRPHIWLSDTPTGPSIILLDKNGFESVLGDIALPPSEGGKAVPPTAASIHLFNQGGKVIWTAP
ncbi:MAG: hypothetical protein ACRD4X_02985 [Candidatus Acidiferrales bacterium]